MIDRTQCESWLYHDLTDQQFCAGKAEGGVDACQVGHVREVRESHNLLHCCSSIILTTLLCIAFREILEVPLCTTEITASSSSGSPAGDTAAPRRSRPGCTLTRQAWPNQFTSRKCSLICLFLVVAVILDWIRDNTRDNVGCPKAPTPRSLR